MGTSIQRVACYFQGFPPRCIVAYLRHRMSHPASLSTVKCVLTTCTDFSQIRLNHPHFCYPSADNGHDYRKCVPQYSINFFSCVCSTCIIEYISLALTYTVNCMPLTLPPIISHSCACVTRKLFIPSSLFIRVWMSGWLDWCSRPDVLLIHVVCCSDVLRMHMYLLLTSHLRTRSLQNSTTQRVSSCWLWLMISLWPTRPTRTLHDSHSHNLIA